MPAKIPFIPPLPKAAWSVLAIITVSSLGTGVTLPFQIFYLHHVRDLSLSHAGLTMAVSTLVAFGGNHLGGVLCDRFNPRSVMTLGLVIEGIGVLFLAGVTELWQAMAAVVLTGAGGGMAWPAQDSLIAVVVPEQDRPAAFAMRHAALNAGLGVGGLSAVWIINSEDSASFVALFLADAATFLIAAGALWLLSINALSNPEVESDGREHPALGYSAILADKTFLMLWLIVFLLVAAGYAQLNSAVPAYLIEEGLHPGMLGAFSAVNAVMVVMAQVGILRFIEGCRRTSLIAILCAFWSAAWIALILVSEASTVLGLTLVIFAAGAFAIGETFLAPSAPVIVNSIAPPEMRGRYNGLLSSAFTLGGFAGISIGGFVLDMGYGQLHFGGCIMVFAVVAFLSLRISRRLSHEANVGDMKA
ncbi:MFS transporter [Streptomyces cinereoruber]|uniref:MFS transporter n=1 Tax=Streptomyces cinereoruber TaxID=67260 RepID=UPI00363222A1